MDIKLYNTLTREKDIFKPLAKGSVGMYNCGPTVYGYAHIGNLRSYVFADTLRKMLEYNGFDVLQIVNITDVGHLTSNEDSGADKLEEAARKTGKTASGVAEFYTKAFLHDLVSLGIDIEKITFPRATKHIPEQIALIKMLEEKGVAYITSDGVYFDTSKIAEYGKLARLDIAGLKSGARVEPRAEKRNVTDFALWKFSSSHHGHRKRQQEWDSPWGVGFPGWHLECSAMSIKYLGEHFDIHTGGVDHISVHHTNEIAQSETATGHRFVNYWLHNEFVNVDGEKMSKSLGNITTLKDIAANNFSALAYRYWLMTAHYRTIVNFTWDALSGAQTALDRLHRQILGYGNIDGTVSDVYKKTFTSHINNDIDTPRAVALVWKLIGDDNISDGDKRATILDFDRVLGLGLADAHPEKIPPDVQILARERERARAEEDWEKADALRDEIETAGFEILDTKGGSVIRKKRQAVSTA